MEYFYIMHLSYNGRKKRELWNYAKNENLIGLDYPKIVTDDWVKIRESVKRFLSKIWVKQFDIFCKEMKIGDVVLVLNGWDSLLGIAEVIERCHRYNRELSENHIFFDHVRRVKWKVKYEYDDRLKLPEPLKGFNNTLSRVVPHKKRWTILSNLKQHLLKHKFR